MLLLLVGSLALLLFELLAGLLCMLRSLPALLLLLLALLLLLLLLVLLVVVVLKGCEQQQLLLLSALIPLHAECKEDRNPNLAQRPG